MDFLHYKKVFVVSDLHLGHEKIIDLCYRPFENVDEMDNTMITNWNSVVGYDDLVICNGDFMFYKQDTGIFNKLKGQKILIKGNHDHYVKKKLGWGAVHDYFEIQYNSIRVVFFHYPIYEWNGKFHGSIHFYGHIHNGIMDQKNSYNICVEKINYTPQNLANYIKVETNEKEKE